MEFRWFPSPPAVSPTAVPALGVGLCFNTLLAAGAVMSHSWFGASDEPFVRDLITQLVSVYAALCLALAVVYGVAAAAWAGWSWWRVPAATLAGATLGWGVNVLGMAWWAARKGWETSPTLAWGSSTQQSVMGMVVMAVLVLIALWATLLSRHFTFGKPAEAPVAPTVGQ